METEKTVYEMNAAELNEEYRNVLQKHQEAWPEAEQAYKLMRSAGDKKYKLMRSAGDKKTQKSNWLQFENAYPPNDDEVEKINFLSLMKAASNDNDANKKTVDSKDDTKKLAELNMNEQ